MLTQNFGLTERLAWPAMASHAVATVVDAPIDEVSSTENQPDVAVDHADQVVSTRLSPARGILTGILLGTAGWAALLVFLVRHW